MSGTWDYKTGFPRLAKRAERSKRKEHADLTSELVDTLKLLRRFMAPNAHFVADQFLLMRIDRALAKAEK